METLREVASTLTADDRMWRAVTEVLRASARPDGKRLSSEFMLKLADDISDLRAHAEKVERERDKARDWNRRMVEMQASGGRLDGYREMGAKLAAVETENANFRIRAEAAEEKIENAAQAMAETQPSWERRCFAIISALELDFGDPTPDVPEQSGWYVRKMAQLEADRDRLAAENAGLREALARSQSRPTNSGEVSRMIRYLPTWMQARYWVWRCGGYSDPQASSWRIEAYRHLRRTAKLPFKDAKTLIDRYSPNPNSQS